MSKINQGGNSGGDPPLPIPNREVKPACADGTAPPGGRVGSCQFTGRIAEYCGPPFFFVSLLNLPLKTRLSMVAWTDIVPRIYVSDTDGIVRHIYDDTDMPDSQILRNNVDDLLK